MIKKGELVSPFYCFKGAFMNTFKYENTVLLRIIMITIALILVCTSAYLFNVSQWQYYFAPICSGVILELIFEFLSYKNIFTKTGEYRTEDTSLYVKKSSGEIEIPMDMVDEIIANRTNLFSASYKVQIQVGKKTYTLQSEVLPKKCDFFDTSLAPIVNEIVHMNPDLEYFPPQLKNNVYIWKYKSN